MHSLSGRHLQPQALLLELSALGFHVMPEDRDAVHSGWVESSAQCLYVDSRLTCTARGMISHALHED